VLLYIQSQGGGNTTKWLRLQTSSSTSQQFIHNIKHMLEELLQKQKEDLQSIKDLLTQIHNVYETALQRLETIEQSYALGKPFGEPTGGDSNDDSVVSISTALNHLDVDGTNIN
jgi:hypothetical protein